MTTIEDIKAIGSTTMVSRLTLDDPVGLELIFKMFTDYATTFVVLFYVTFLIL